ncbi:MAG: hypothetical protein LBL24_02800 [Bacteroidales bacterium]|jgi:hypothetical protein|nr:hypothetical protein [Bacteroidales bacterium]
MNGIDFLPKNDRNLLQWVVNFLTYLMTATAMMRFHFPQAVYDRLVMLRDEFAQKLDVAENPATRTRLSIQAKNTARKVLTADVRLSVKEYLAYNHEVTDEDRDGLGIPVHKTTRTPSPVAKEAPEADTDTSVIGRITIGFFEKGNRHKKAKPEGQHCVEIAWVLSDTPVTRWDGLIHSSVDTNSPFTLVFENDQRGKTVYFALRWENTRGEKGPWGEIYNAIIP